jgi:hypothetical protein
MASLGRIDVQPIIRPCGQDASAFNHLLLSSKLFVGDFYSEPTAASRVLAKAVRFSDFVIRGYPTLFNNAVDGQRLLAMVPQELRWMDNLKKAFYESDAAFAGGRAVDKAFPEICNAVDVAGTLQLSLQSPVAPWAPPTNKSNKRKFIGFLHTEIPDADNNGVNIPLLDARTEKWENYNFGGIVYAIRCMIHENENLNADENPDYHVILDWNIPANGYLGSVCDGRLTCNAQAIWWRVREVLAKFILGTEMLMAFERGDNSFSIHCRPPLKSIHPGDGRHKTAATN